MSVVFSRRCALGAGVAFTAGCIQAPATDVADDDGVEQIPTGRPSPYADNVDALFDVLLPVETDEQGAVVVPGAREVGAAALLDVRDFVPLAQTQGLLPALSSDVAALLQDVDHAFRAALNIDLDVLAAFRSPTTPFRDLARVDQEAIVDEAFADDARKALFAVVRAAAFAGFLGAGNSDAGLIAVGHPPFESFADGVAVAGYPRTIDGRVDDYTYNLEPPPTPGVDLSDVLDERGDLY